MAVLTVDVAVLFLAVVTVAVLTMAVLVVLFRRLYGRAEHTRRLPHATGLPSATAAAHNQAGPGLAHPGRVATQVAAHAA